MTALFWKRPKGSIVLVITSRQLSCLLRINTARVRRYHRGQHGGAFTVTTISAGFQFEEVIYHTFFFFFYIFSSVVNLCEVLWTVSFFSF